MTFGELTELAAARMNRREEDVADMLDGVLQVIRETVAHGGEVDLPDFGTFGAQSEATVTGPHPIEGQDCPQNRLGCYVLYPGGYEPWFSADEAFKGLTRSIGGRR